MKKALLTFLACIVVIIIGLMVAVSTDEPATEFVIASAPEGIQVGTPSDNFNLGNYNYQVFTELKNKGDKSFEYLQVTTVYLDDQGNKLGEAIGGPGRVFAPGDSAVIQTAHFFMSDKIPAKVEITVSDM